MDVIAEGLHEQWAHSAMQLIVSEGKLATQLLSLQMPKPARRSNLCHRLHEILYPLVSVSQPDNSTRSISKIYNCTKSGHLLRELRSLLATHVKSPASAQEDKFNEARCRYAS